MVSARRSQRLALWMNGEHVGWWSNAAAGRQTLEYAESWLHSPLARPLSLSLPLMPGGARLHGPRVRDWFDNLLPDSQPIRERLATRFRTGSTAAFELLREIGRDCVGAVQLLEEDQEPDGLRRIAGEPLSDDDIERLLGQVVTSPALALRDGDDLRISIAGAQEKTALLRQDGRWYRPLGATPTTHILKLPLGRVGNLGVDLSGSVENEWLCSRLVAAFGLRVAHCEIARFGASKVLVVERFDRRLADDGRWLLRLPQEDFCQATATSPLQKYEADGGPGMRDILGILATSDERERDRREFFVAQVLFHVLAATDGHAKNFSLAIGAGGSFAMTPLYDILSAWPVCGEGPGLYPYRRLKLAMAVRTKNAHYHLHEIHRRHWIEFGRRSGLGPEVAVWLDAIIERAPGAIRSVAAELPADFPVQIFEAVTHGLSRSLQALRG